MAVSKQQVEAELQDSLGNGYFALTNSGKLKIVQSENDLPDVLRRALGNGNQGTALKSANTSSSMLVGENGEPIVVYREGSVITSQRGFHFSDSKERAASYGTSRAYNLQVGNPYVTDFNGNMWDEGDGDFVNIDDIVNYAKREGFDGVVAHNVVGREGDEPTTEYVAYDPSQIVQADPNILYSKKQPVNISSREFQAWFSDSQIVNAEGEPLVVYHGSDANIEQFDTLAGGYFTEDTDYAGHYAGKYNDDNGVWERGVGDNITPVYLSLASPKMFNSSFGNKPTGKNFYHLTPDVISEYQQQGHDGLIFKTENRKEYVVFSPAQIKSTLGNTGAFSQTNPNILQSKAKALGSAGIYYGGAITLLADNIGAGQAEYVLQHEGLHLLMHEDELFMEKRTEILGQFKKLKDNDQRVREAYGQVPDDTKINYVDEEALSYFVQNKSNHQHGIFQKLKANIKAWLFRKSLLVGKLGGDDFVALATQGLTNFIGKLKNEPESVVGSKEAPCYCSLSEHLGEIPQFQEYPDDERVKHVKQWLKDKSDRYENNYVTMYHGTGEGIPIAEEGIKPTSEDRRRSYQSTSGYAYLAPTYAGAKLFGDLGNMSKSKVYAVKVLVRNLKADLDQLHNQRSVGLDVGNSLAESVVFGRSLRIKGAIQPWQVQEVTEPLLSTQNDNWYYSQMARFIGDKLPEKGSAESFKQVIESFAKKGHFKQEELAWSELIPWLDAQTGTIYKKQVLDYIEVSGVQVTEVTKGGTVKKITNAEIDDIRVDDHGQGQWVVTFNNGIESVEFPLCKADDKFEAADYAIDQATLGEYGYSDRPKYDQYALPGGDNYREILLTLPSETKSLEAAAFIAAQRGDRAEHKRLTIQANLADDDFRTSHWDESNVLAHIRINDRDVDGEKVLFIEEMQSDWALDGRKKGNSQEKKKRLDELHEKFFSGVLTPAEDTEFQQLMEQNKDGGMPESPKAPFVRNNNWQNLALKRIMRLAAVEGYDRVAWINGEQTAERYSLDKQVEIEYNKKSNNQYWLHITEAGTGKDVQETIVSEAELDGLVGKGVAQKIIAGEGQAQPVSDSLQSLKDRGYSTGTIEKGGSWYIAFENGDEFGIYGSKASAKLEAVRIDKYMNKIGNTILAGDDLKIEAGWARNLYDKVVPNWMKKFSKKYGETCEAITIVTKNDGDSFNALSVPITPEMRSDIMCGLPLFSKQLNDIEADEEESCSMGM